MSEHPDRAAVIAPPPLLFALCVISAFVIDHFRPLPLVRDFGRSRYVLSGALFLIGIAIGTAAIRRFRAHGEHPSPYEPTNTIVESGIYRFTRNPIYVGFFIILAAIAVIANSWWILISAIPLFLLLQFGVVRREEAYLSRKFGSSYDDYRRRVRRWF